MVSTMAPPTTQPAVAAMMGLSVVKPEPGMQRHSSGRLLTSAPDENASLPAPVITATRCSEASNSAKPACSSSAVSLQMAFLRAGRLMVNSVTLPCCSMVICAMDDS